MSLMHKILPALITPLRIPSLRLLRSSSLSVLPPLDLRAGCFPHWWMVCRQRTGDLYAGPARNLVAGAHQRDGARQSPGVSLLLRSRQHPDVKSGSTAMTMPSARTCGRDWLQRQWLVEGHAHSMSRAVGSRSRVWRARRRRAAASTFSGGAGRLR
jgi:hypothetical protein